MATLVTRRALLAASASFATLAAFPSLARAADGKLSTAALTDLQAAMDAHVASGYLPGAVWAVEHDGELHVGASGTFELGGGAPMARDTIFRIASITKPVTAAIAMMLVEEGKLTLDGPVDDLMPELADRRVLRTLESALDDTVPAERPITLRHLLTMTFGLGAVMVFPEAHPIQAAMREAGFAPGYMLPQLSSDAYMAALGSLPLAAQPGDRFLYNTGLDIAGILIERVEGKRLGAVMEERLFAPLGMKDTGFSVPADKLDRLPMQYGPDYGNPGAIKPFLPAEWMDYAKEPPLDSGAGGLVSTVDDYLQFCRMMMNGGELDGRRYLKAESVAEMARDQLTDAHKADPMASFFLSEGGGTWGLGMAVMTKKVHPWMTPGRFGWDGGFGTSAYTDPATRTIGILLTQRMMDSPTAPVTFTDFWSHAYKATES
jgi:CubicO group peptidase (beta-lactamase class C family)